MDVILVLGAFAGMLIAFYKFLGTTLAQGATDREADRKERIELTQAIKDMAESTKEVAEATIKGNKEAKQRNGHLGEQNIQIAELVSRQNNDVAEIKKSNAIIARTLQNSALIAAEDKEALTNTQVILEQTVEHQIVKDRK
jgi:hypothetical protein